MQTMQKPTVPRIDPLQVHAKRRISDDEQLRLYRLAMRGVEAKIGPRAYRRSA
jgi:hypothetical protein